MWWKQCWSCWCTAGTGVCIWYPAAIWQKPVSVEFCYLKYVHWSLVLLLPRHCYERAIAIEKMINPVAPRTGGLQIDIGCLLMRKGDYRLSIAFFEKAIAEYMQNMPPAYVNSEVICFCFPCGDVCIELVSQKSTRGWWQFKCLSK